MNEDQSVAPAPAPAAPMASEPAKGPAYGPILGIIVIVAILVAGAFYVWGERLNDGQVPENGVRGEMLPDGSMPSVEGAVEIESGENGPQPI